MASKLATLKIWFSEGVEAICLSSFASAALIPSNPKDKEVAKRNYTEFGKYFQYFTEKNFKSSITNQNHFTS